MQNVPMPQIRASETAQRALHNATSFDSDHNYAAIYAGFTAKGIPQSEILPRVNVFTYDAWKAIGRQVRRGEHGVRIETWVPMTKKDEDTGEEKPIGRKPRITTVFHVSQTDFVGASGKVSYADLRAQADAVEAKPTPAPRDNFAPTGKPDPMSSINASFEYFSDEFTPIKK